MKTSQILIFFSYILLWMGLCVQPIMAQHYSFVSVTEDSGVAFPTRLNYIFEGSRGCIWIATRSGLGRYDGNNLRKYEHIEGDEYSLPDNDVYYLFEDEENELWVITPKGIARFDYGEDRFYLAKDTEGNTFGAYTACTWKDGILLGQSNKLQFYRPKDQTMTLIGMMPGSRPKKIVKLDDNTVLCQCTSGIVWRFAMDTNRGGNGDPSPFTIKNARSRSILLDSQKRVWVGTISDGLYCFSMHGELIKHYAKDKGNFPTKGVESLVESKGYIVAGTKQEGVVIMLPETGQQWQFRHNPGDGRFAIPGNTINELYTDKYGMVMMAIADHGLVAFDQIYMRSFSANNASYGKGPTAPSIVSLWPNGDKLWVGTAGGGLNIFDPEENTFTPVPSTAGTQIYSITDYAPGKLLLSVFDQGMRIFDTATGSLTPLKMSNDTIDRNCFRQGNGVYLYRNTPETILIVAYTLFIYHPKEQRFSEAIIEKDVTVANATLKVVSSNDTVTYLCDRNHLFQFDHKSEKMNVIYTLPTDKQLIYIATQSPDGLFWLGTNQGLIKFDRSTKIAKPVETNMFKEVLSIHVDPNGLLWVGTYSDLFAYNPQNNHVVAFSRNEGVDPNEYNRTVTLQLGDRLYMGGAKGLVKIDYNNAIQPNERIHFAVSRYTVNGERKGFPYHGDKIEKLEVPNESNLELQILTDEKRRFRARTYRFNIPGYTDEPIEQTDSELKLYHLAMGTYEVQVSSTQNDGSWSPYQTVTKIKVLPPYYLRWWFLTPTILVILIILGGLFYTMQLKRKQKLEQDLARNRLQLNEEKVDFLVNISHELRTPLTLVYAPIRRVLQQCDPQDKSYLFLQTAYRHALRMTNIINMVLDLEKMQRQSIKLHMHLRPFNEWIKEELKDYLIEGAERNVEVRFEPDDRIGEIPFDKSRMDIVLNNLLMNALKHSPANTTLTVKSSLEEPSKQVRLSVSDEGPGLQPGDEKGLFTRFYQSNKEKTGTGLGLAYSKVLIDQHKGTIGAYNNKTKGATFFFTLPLEQTAETVDSGLTLTQLTENAFRSETETANPQATNTISSDEVTKGCTLLIVDDQESISHFLKETLSESFKEVLTAKDGVEALKVLRDNHPDAVVSDIMMPRMDGYELCRQIKQDITISHIPVILLTAKTDERSVLMGYKTGADAYLPKPFDLEVLKQIIVNQLNRHQRIQDKVAMPGTTPLPQEITISYADEAFLTKMNKVIEQHISNNQLDISLLEKEMGMSRASLFNKMKALLGMGCNEYITKLRMEKAIRMVKESTLSFAEISEEVGYNTPSYFSSAFKQYTGMTPTQYRKEHRTIPTNDV